MQVFIVLSGTCDSYMIQGVFATEAHANRFVRELQDPEAFVEAHDVIGETASGNGGPGSFGNFRASVHQLRGTYAGLA